MRNVFLSSNPLSSHALSYLRDKNTILEIFRQYSDMLSQFLIAEACIGLSLEETPVTTPLQTTTAMRLKSPIVLIPILRAGLAMLSAGINFLPHAHVGFAGLARDEKTAIAEEYYWKMPEIKKDGTIMILDPMLATGGSLIHVLRKLNGKDIKEIHIVCVIAAPEGIDAITGEFPSVKIFTACIDEKLNDKKYIVPGLGDYGDRYFGTE